MMSHADSDPLSGDGAALAMPGPLDPAPQVSDVGEANDGDADADDDADDVEDDDDIVIDGFAIDSDDEDEDEDGADGAPSNPFRDDPHEEIDLGGAGGGAVSAAETEPGLGGSISKLITGLGAEATAPAATGMPPPVDGSAAGAATGVDHPLSDGYLRVAPSANSANAAASADSANASANAAPIPPADAAAPASTPLQTPAKRDLASGGLHTGLLGLRSSATSSVSRTSSGAKAAGAFLSGFARDAARSLQEAAEGATKVVKEVGEKAAQAGSGSGAGAGSGQLPRGMQPGQIQPAQAQTQTQAVAQQTAQAQAQQPQIQAQKPQTQAQAQAVAPMQTQAQQAQAQPGMDNALKSSLITSALSRSGGLLDGERVVVFLSPLSGVRDSGWAQTFVGTEGHDTDGNAGGGGAREVPKWCCAVTFYRLVVFSYLESEFAAADGDGAAGDATAAAPGSDAGSEEKKEPTTPDATASEMAASTTTQAAAAAMAAVDVDELNALVGTASVSRRYQSLRSRLLPSPNSGSARRRTHHVMELPLASIERVERTVERPPPVLQPYSSSGGGVGSGMVSGVAGGIGNVAGNVAGGVAGFAGAVGSAMGAFPTPGGGSAGGGQMIASPSLMIANGSSSAGGAGAYVGLAVYSKHNSSWLRFAAPSYGDASRAHEVLNTYAFPGRRNLGYLFAFESRRAEVMASVKRVDVGGSAAAGGVGGGAEGGTAGAQAQQRITSRATPRRYDAMAEYGRMGVVPAAAATALAADGTAPAAAAAAPPVRSSPSPWSPLLRSNATYGLCPSYPSILFGPSAVDDSHPDGLRLVRKVAAFRSEGRMPALSWSSCVDGASLWRASQPRVGLQGNRSAADERYLRLIGECAANARAEAVHVAAATASAAGAGLAAEGARKQRTPSLAFLRMLTGGANDEDLLGPQRNGVLLGGGSGGGVGGNAAAPGGRCLLKIMDLRPKSSAMANRTQGYGYENTSYYPHSTLTFCGIGNIHAVRDAYQKMSALCLNPSADDVRWSQLVEDTRWLSQVRLILSASWQAAFHVRYNRLPVLLHCSHGWDRTSQVSALAQLLLDPYYRTRGGFAALVEKEFMALGHPFHTRCGHGEGRGGGGDRGGPGSQGGPSGGGGSGGGGGAGGGGADENQISPIFLQFVDCAYQIVRQYPDRFEFNERYLLLLTEHLYSCRFGTLLCDTEREREHVAGIRQRTHCLWEYLDGRPDLVNASYVRRDHATRAEEEEEGALMMPLPSLLRNVVLWTDRHCMHGPKATARCIPPDLDAFLRENEPTAMSAEAGAGAAATAGAEAEGAANDGVAEGGVEPGLSVPPLLVAGDMDRAALRRAEREAAKWRELAERRLAELEALKGQSQSQSRAENLQG